MKRVALLLPVLLLALGIGYYLAKERRGAEPPEAAPPASAAGAPTAAPAPAPGAGGAPSPAPGTSAAPDAPQGAGTSLPPANGASPSFLAYLADDAKELSATRVNVAAAEERTRRQVAAMGPAEARYAHALVLSNAAPANQRILAAYTLGEVLRTQPKGSPGYGAALEAAREIVTRPSSSARAEPHTMAEVQNAQAKSLALMNVDALADRAAKDPAAREELARWAAQAKDPAIQKYIQGRLRGLPPL
jgi:hypothetical protein